MKCILLFILSISITSLSFGQAVSRVKEQPTENTLVTYPGESQDGLFQQNPEFKNIRAIAPAKKDSNDKLIDAGKFFLLVGSGTGTCFLGRAMLRGMLSYVKESVDGAFDVIN